MTADIEIAELVLFQFYYAYLSRCFIEVYVNGNSKPAKMTSTLQIFKMINTILQQN